MSVIRTAVVVIVCIVLAFATARVQAQSVIKGPVLGYTLDTNSPAVLPILGVPGAALIGDPINSDAAITPALISPDQKYGLGVRQSDGQPVVVTLVDGFFDVRPVDGVPGADFMAVSPSGSTAAFYDNDSRDLQVFAHLPSQPEKQFALNTTILPGATRNIAVSDDGRFVLFAIAEEDRRALWLADATGTIRHLATNIVAAAFIPNRNDALVIDDSAQAAFLLLDVPNNATQVPLLFAGVELGGLSAIAASSDGRRAFIASERTGTIATIDLASGATTFISCECRPKGLFAIGGTDLFRLNDSSDQPMSVLDGSGPEPRVIVIPPRQVGATPTEGSRQDGQRVP